MRREEDRAADVAQLAHHALEQVRRLRVEADERFVHDDELRVVDPRRDDGELLLHAVRVRADRLTEITRELECVGIRLDARPALRGRNAENVGNEVQVLDAAHEIVQIRIVRDVGEQLLAGQRLGLDGVPADRDLARVKLQDADGRLERRRLAGAVVADEGAELRRAGITTGIIVMNPEMTAFNTLFQYDLEPEVYSFKLLDALAHAAEKEGIQAFPVHIKLDTGMHRLGFNPLTDVPQVIDHLKRQSAIVPRSVFSHFVGSDSPDFDEFSQHQFDLFDKASRQLQAAFPDKVLRHICNSAGIERFPERHLDMVRLGLGLYGIDPIDNRRLHNVTSLRTTILQIRNVPKGDSIGYSRRSFVDRDSRIAAIPIGYADGLNRHLGNRHCYCLVNGHKAPYIGNICMDVCMIDVTDIPCQEGDTVEIFGDNLPVTVLSDVLDTIPYEVLTSVSTRVKRVYFQ